MSKLLTPAEVVRAIQDGRKVEFRDPNDDIWYELKVWESVSLGKLLNSAWQFRLVQEVVVVGDVSFPKPESRAPEIGGMCYMPYLNAPTFCAQYHWDDSEADQVFLKAGLVHLSRENAIAHAKALIKLSGGECE